MSDRPDCLGFHEPDPVCDGDPLRLVEDPPCAWRERCLAVCALKRSNDDGEVKRAIAAARKKGFLRDEDAGRESIRLKDKVARVEVPEEMRGETRPDPRVRPSEPDPDAPPKNRAIRTLKGQRVRTPETIYAQPRAFAHVTPAVIAFAKRFAHEIGVSYRREGDPDALVGDVFIRWTGGMEGRQASVYQAVDGGTTRHRLITRVVMMKRHATFAMKTAINADDIDVARSCTPPAGVSLDVWQDTYPCVALAGVSAESAVEAAQWLHRCYVAEIVRPRKTNETWKHKKKKAARAAEHRERMRLAKGDR